MLVCPEIHIDFFYQPFFVLIIVIRELIEHSVFRVKSQAAINILDHLRCNKYPLAPQIKLIGI